MPDFSGDLSALHLEPAPPGVGASFHRAADLVCASPTTARLLFAALVILVILACAGVRVEQGPRR